MDAAARLSPNIEFLSRFPEIAPQVDVLSTVPAKTVCGVLILLYSDETNIQG